MKYTPTNVVYYYHAEQCRLRPKANNMLAAGHYSLSTRIFLFII